MNTTLNRQFSLPNINSSNRPGGYRSQHMYKLQPYQLMFVRGIRAITNEVKDSEGMQAYIAWKLQLSECRRDRAAFDLSFLSIRFSHRILFWRACRIWCQARTNKPPANACMDPVRHGQGIKIRKLSLDKETYHVLCSSAAPFVEQSTIQTFECIVRSIHPTILESLFQARSSVIADITCLLSNGLRYT
ncbi:hypothetical protein BDV41DRAFT_546359 [Aspergillus transmontanensis]|uniref:Uncharacterized protein n=1 Tax=Aspergillus transmontanensis TaxID=1034304 RepID=A0A5N6VNI1_9EURO|nr:hypothetical protein BDV41DRAFT_546359 [Aspergillus transmontanensis]